MLLVYFLSLIQEVTRGNNSGTKLMNEVIRAIESKVHSNEIVRAKQEVKRSLSPKQSP
jgi:hypothetical protein